MILAKPLSGCACALVSLLRTGMGFEPMISIWSVMRLAADHIRISNQPIRRTAPAKSRMAAGMIQIGILQPLPGSAGVSPAEHPIPTNYKPARRRRSQEFIFDAFSRGLAEIRIIQQISQHRDGIASRRPKPAEIVNRGNAKRRCPAFRTPHSNGAPGRTRTDEYEFTKLAL